MDVEKLLGSSAREIPGLIKVLGQTTRKGGTLANGTNLNDIREPGTYFLSANGGYLGVPSDLIISEGHHFLVYAQGNSAGIGDTRFLRQELISARKVEAGNYYKRNRTLDRDNPTSANSLWALSSGVSNRLSGKTVVVFGDSIAEGSPTANWPRTMAGRFPAATVINGAFGGCRMAAHTGTSVSALYDPMSMYRISERIKNGDWSVLTAAAQALFDAEGDDNRPQAAALAGLDWSKDIVIVIAYGTNDFRGTAGAGVPLGADDDMTGATFKGAINLSISNILTAYPQIKLMFMTPLWRSRVETSGEDSNLTPNGSGVFLREYAQAIKDRAAPYQIPVADLHDKSGINILNWPAYMPDGLHTTTTLGVQRIADFAAAQIETLF